MCATSVPLGQLLLSVVLLLTLTKIPLQTSLWQGLVLVCPLVKEAVKWIYLLDLMLCIVRLSSSHCGCNTKSHSFQVGDLTLGFVACCLFLVVVVVIVVVVVVVVVA